MILNVTLEINEKKDLNCLKRKAIFREMVKIFKIRIGLLLQK